GCPFCSGLKVSASNSLSELFPDIAAQWHPTKNGDLRPDQVVAGSNKLFWWKCPEGPDHEGQAASNDGTFGARGCPFCKGLKVSVADSLAARFPDLAAQWHPTKNGDLTPDRVVTGSNKAVWWQCPKSAEHHWQSTVVNRTNLERGCPYCAGK